MNDSAILEHLVGRRADGPLDPANAQEAIELWLESAQRHGDEIPESDPVCERMIAHGDGHLMRAIDRRQYWVDRAISEGGNP